MGLITPNDLQPFTRPATYNFSQGTLEKRASARLSERTNAAKFDATYDIFLSHKFSDADQLEALMALLQSLGHSVYVDWVEDTDLDRRGVTPTTALVLKWRMQQCRCLFYATTRTHAESKWMPWELGYFDGQKAGRVAICPVMANVMHFQGQEYLGIYPYVDKTGNTLWIHSQQSGKYVRFSDWLAGANPPSS